MTFEVSSDVMADPSASYRANPIDYERAKTDAELDALAERVRSTQRFNLLLETSVCLLPIGGCLGGDGPQMLAPHQLANAWFLLGGVGVAVAVGLLEKYERQLPE